MLTPETEQLLAERVLIKLSLQFPEHEFEAGVADVEEFENSILPVQDSTNEASRFGEFTLLDRTELQRVRDAFDVILVEAKDWNPS